MIKKNQISLGEGIVLDLKSNLSLSKAGTNDFPIIDIGASAGGLEAIALFFKNMSIDSGLSFTAIQHTDSTHIKIIPELSLRMKEMKVLQAAHTLKVKRRNCIYVIPPDISLSIVYERIHLFVPTESSRLQLSVAIFLESLAMDRMEKSIGLNLTRMGSGGSLGLKAIVKKNDIAAVQDPASPKFDDMLRTSIKSIVPDIVVPVKKLPAKRINVFHYLPVINIVSEFLFKTKSSINKISMVSREQTLLNFLMNNKNTLRRRIKRRKGIHQIDKIQRYVRFLQENQKEIEVLFKDLLKEVFSFFRDNDVWIKLKEEIIPNILKEISDGQTVKIWCSVYSTGEEAYSLIIVFDVVLSKLKKPRNIKLQIFATDVDILSIDKPKKRFFYSSVIKDVSQERIDKFFKPENDSYRINTSICELTVFVPQKVIKDSSFTKLNQLTNNNMLIYMEPELQNISIMLFNYSLNQGTIMMFGTAEIIASSIKGFEVLNSKLKFYKRISKSVSLGFMNFPNSFSQTRRITIDILKETKVVENLQTLPDQISLPLFSPASIFVNNEVDIIYVTGRTGKYLESAACKANWNVHVMERKGLKQELREAFRKAVLSFEPVHIDNVKIAENENFHLFNLTVQQIESADAIKGLIMIVFKDIPAIAETVSNTLTAKNNQFFMNELAEQNRL
ncbi:CheR family methyltransferase [Flavobacterium sp. DSR3-2]|uniref:CheR family methyltransferase n=1 Tax=Flavobacterium sp. DSR3-2 TaxID=2804634 RepID=UPI003CED0387